MRPDHCSHGSSLCRRFSGVKLKNGTKVQNLVSSYASFHPRYTGKISSKYLMPLFIQNVQAEDLRLGFGTNSVSASSQPPKEQHEVKMVSTGVLIRKPKLKFNPIEPGSITS